MEINAVCGRMLLIALFNLYLSTENECPRRAFIFNKNPTRAFIFPHGYVNAPGLFDQPNIANICHVIIFGTHIPGAYKPPGRPPLKSKQGSQHLFSFG